MDENYQCLKDEATKTKQALENAFTEKETQKAKLKSSYKLFGKNDDEITSSLLEIESNRKNTGLPVDEEYNNSYWKWKDADEANEKAQIALKKYDENYNADIPDVMIELKEVKQQNEEMQRQNEELRKEIKSQNEELKKQNEEMKNEMQEMKAMLPQMMMKVLYTHDFFSNITPAFNGENKEVDIVFPEPVEARFITFKPKTWRNEPWLRCEVYVDNVLQNTPLNQRSFSSSNCNDFKDSTMNAKSGWLHKHPFNANEWLKLDLQQVKTITGIRVGTYIGDASRYVSKLALEFDN